MSADPVTPLNEEPQAPQIAPDIGRGHPEYHFLVATMELQKEMVQMKSSLNELQASVNRMRTSVDSLVNWKAMILGGAAATGFLIGLAIALYKIFIDKAT